MEERLGDLAMWWGNQYYCDTVVGNPSACPDGLQLLACLVYPVRNTAVTVEAARTVANLAYYASSALCRPLLSPCDFDVQSTLEPVAGGERVGFTS
jgi:hypothetical protein